MPKSNKSKIVKPRHDLTTAGVPPMLVTRTEARRLLGGPSTQHMLMLEKAGALTKVRINPQSATARVYYRYEQIVALANGATVEETRPRRYDRKSREVRA